MDKDSQPSFMANGNIITDIVVISKKLQLILMMVGAEK